MRLAAADRRRSRRACSVDVGGVRRRTEIVRRRACRGRCPPGVALVADVAATPAAGGVCAGICCDGQRDLLGAAGLGQDEAVALVDRNPPAQVGQRERALAVAAVGRADQLEQRLVLGDRQQLALAEHPARGGEVAREHPDLADIWLCHRRSSSVRRREDALQRDAEVQRQERLHVQVRLAAADVRDRRRAQRDRGCAARA